MEANYDNNPFKMMASLAASFAQQLEELGKRYAEAMQQLRALTNAAQNEQKVASNSATASAGNLADFNSNEMGKDALRMGQTAFLAHDAIMNQRTVATNPDIDNNAQKLFKAHRIFRN